MVFFNFLNQTRLTFSTAYYCWGELGIDGVYNRECLHTRPMRSPDVSFLRKGKWADWRGAKEGKIKLPVKSNVSHLKGCAFTVRPWPTLFGSILGPQCRVDGAGLGCRDRRLSKYRKNKLLLSSLYPS